MPADDRDRSDPPQAGGSAGGRAAPARVVFTPAAIRKTHGGKGEDVVLLAFREAGAYPGASLILACSHCIAHGYDLRQGMHR